MLVSIMKTCLDCDFKLKNRSRDRLRCWACHLKYIHDYPKITPKPNCINCGKELSTRVNKTLKCFNCYERRPWNKGKSTGRRPWNKGKSRFANKEEERLSKNEKRRINRKKQTSFEFISDRIRTLIRNSLKRVSVKKTTKTAKLLGCSTAEFKKHLELQFVNGMDWNNYGNKEDQWNIDHIIQLCEFDLTDLDQQAIAFHFTNCRPLWAKLNKTRPKIKLEYLISELKELLMETNTGKILGVDQNA